MAQNLFPGIKKRIPGFFGVYRKGVCFQASCSSLLNFGDRTGKIVLSREGRHYEDPEETLDVPLASLPGISADYSKGFIVLYQGDLIRRFYLDDRRMTARFVNSLMVLKGLK